MRHRLRTSIAGAMLLVVPALLPAQRPVPVAATRPPRAILSPDTTRRAPPDAPRRIGIRDRIAVGMVAGMAVGMAVGVAKGVRWCRPENECYGGAPSGVLLGMIVGGGAGMAAGGVTGGVLHVVTWPLRRLRA